MFSTNTGPTGKKKFNLRRKILNQMFRDSIEFFQGLIEFTKGLIARKINF